MASPFPGMDPYLERHWPDVHSALAVLSRAALNRILPEDLVASVEESESVGIGDDQVDFRPDVKVSRLPWDGQAIADRLPTSVAAPFRLATSEPELQRSVQITEVGSERLVTVIEFLSPTDKSGQGIRAFVAKRNELLRAGVSVVEVDLVRRGSWEALFRPFKTPAEGAACYRATTRLAGSPSEVFYYPLPLRERLRDIPVPLRRDDPEVVLPLQVILGSAYGDGRYDRRLNYGSLPEPPFDDEDDERWVAEVASRARAR